MHEISYGIYGTKKTIKIKLKIKLGQMSEIKTRGSVGWACAAHLSFYFEETLYRTFHRCFLPYFCSFGYSVSEENLFFFFKSTNQKQELPVVAMFVNGSGQNEHS